MNGALSRPATMQGWMSPRFGPIGCLGAAVFVIVIVAAILGLLYIPWSLVTAE